MPVQDGDLDFLSDSKSYLYDQKDEIEYEEKFKQRLFKLKETNRLLLKEKLDQNNYIPNQENKKYLEYQQNKKTLINHKIDRMMGNKKHNEQLKLLIDSGITDDLEKLR